MDLPSIQRTYRFYARGYDVFFGPLVNPGRRRAVAMINRKPGQRILEVGVGTALSLPFYRADSKVVGIDVSPEMLARAHRRVESQRLHHVEDLLEMDAEALDFPDGSFDAVVAMYVASVVPDPARMMQEIRRVCAPRGDVVVLNHFTSQRGMARVVERGMAVFSRRIGFRSDFPLEPFLEVSDLNVLEVRKTNLFGYWKLIHCRNRPGNAHHNPTPADVETPFEPEEGEAREALS